MIAISIFSISKEGLRGGGQTRMYGFVPFKLMCWSIVSIFSIFPIFRFGMYRCCQCERFCVHVMHQMEGFGSYDMTDDGVMIRNRNGSAHQNSKHNMAELTSRIGIGMALAPAAVRGLRGAPLAWVRVRPRRGGDRDRGLRVGAPPPLLLRLRLRLLLRLLEPERPLLLRLFVTDTEAPPPRTSAATSGARFRCSRSRSPAADVGVSGNGMLLLVVVVVASGSSCRRWRLLLLLFVAPLRSVSRSSSFSDGDSDSDSARVTGRGSLWNRCCFLSTSTSTSTSTARVLLQTASARRGKQFREFLVRIDVIH